MEPDLAVWKSLKGGCLVEQNTSIRIIAMSDLHLSKKPWQVRKAFRMSQGADLVLLVGDLTNDGTAAQMELMHKCIEDVLPDTPVLAVTGNHDYPSNPAPMIPVGSCDYPAMQRWLLGRQPYPVETEPSGAWAVRIGDMEILGLNCASHWRRFVFRNGDQLRWLSEHLETSDARRHIVLCHAPLLSHNPKRSDKKPYLSRDDQLEAIINAHRDIIFISGHTHISMESAIPCVEYDRERNNLYINDGSICPTTVLTPAGKPTAAPAVGNIVELMLSSEGVTVTGRSMVDGSPIVTYQFCSPTQHEAEVL